MKNTPKTPLALVIAAICANAGAQENFNANNGALNNSEATLAPVTVTARGFAENVLDTPFVVNTLSENTLQDQHINSVEDAVRSQPSSDVHNGGNVAYSTLWMRGSGSLSITSLDDNSVDFRIDGISNGKTGLARNLIDVETIEVAKGPQGTLLGAKAEAGIYIIKTNDPEDEFDARIGVGIGNQNQKSAEAVLNLPVSDNIAVRIAGMTSQQDNYLIKKEDGKPLNKKKKQGVQAKIGWHDDSYKNNVVFGVYHDSQSNDVPLLQKDFSTYEVATFNLPHHSKSTAQGATLSIDSELDFADFSSNTGYHKYKGDIARPYLPPEMLPLQYAAFRVPPPLQPFLNQVFSQNDNNRQRLYNDYKQLSQEFKLTSKPDSDIKWVTGLYIEKRERNMHSDAKLSLQALPPSPVKQMLTSTAGNGDYRKQSKSSSQAIFGEITYPATDKLNLVAGARLTHEKLEHTATWQGNSNNPQAAAGIKKDSKIISDAALTGRLGLSYKVTPQFSVYALQSRGHKFGGFDDYETSTFIDKPLKAYKPTKIDASEIGAKYQSTDKRLNLGVAVYQTNMKDSQIKSGGMPPAYISEAANVDSRSRGFEVNGDWQSNDNWRLYGDAAIIDAKVTHAAPEATIITQTSNKMPQVPNFSASLGIRYSDDLAWLNKGHWFTNVNYRYVGSRYAQPDNVQKLGSYGLLDASIGIGNDHHCLNLWGKNLGDKKYLYIGVQPGNVGTLAPERTFGLDYQYQF
ncbi:MAG: hypothetical protein CR974_03715 [Gammaproteobacteria bacterium]|nr:MAG: hypothetical protein CR974_03715 [Gammaproteobacteria bacterium]